ncbi:hypothetical protein AX16_009063 [Volvariella volvacea WC 439]|nr:hypothetical protein AX16_009063 [Volvariella volvacea WC 439]
MVVLCNKEVPQELIGDIISFFKGYQRTLRACSLVCRSFTPYAQQYIFYHLRIRRASDIENPVLYYKGLIEGVGGHLKHVRSLRIAIAGHQSSLPVLVPILERMVNLERVELEYDDSSAQLLKLVYLCCKPTVTRFDCHGTGAPGGYLRQCVSLQHLGLYRLKSPMYPEPDSPRFQVPLKSVFICHLNEGLYRWLLTPGCPVSLHSLNALGIKLVDPSDFVQRAKPLIERCSSLEVLAISPPAEFAVPLDSPSNHQFSLLDLGLLPRITCLVFSFYEMPEEKLTSTPWVISQLSRIPINNNLTELHIWLYDDDYHDPIPENVMFGDHWNRNLQRLDDLLSEPRFDKLRDVYMDVSGMEDYAEHAALVRDMMKKTRERKSLYVIKDYWDGLKWFDAIDSEFQERIAAIKNYARKSG